MAFKEVVIKLTKCILVLYENELWKLPPDILEKAIKRGKVYKRLERIAQYEKPRTDHYG